MKRIYNFENFNINEKLMRVNQDVDLIYNLYFKEAYKKIRKTGKVNHSMFKEYVSDTSILMSNICKKAHNINPCTIYINKYNINFYDPNNKIINITYPINAVNFIISEGDGFLDKALNKLDKIDHNLKKSLSREFKESTIKGSIHHELVHWLDDTLHGKHIKQKLNLAKEKGDKIENINSKFFEIQSQIHNIKQLYRKNKKIWDNISFDEMLELSPTLNRVNKSLPYSIKINWRKNLKKRMNREGLLGDNMR